MNIKNLKGITLCLSLLLFASQLNAGEMQRISIQCRNARLTDLLEVIKQKTGANLLWLKGAPKLQQRVSVQVESQPWKIALDEILANADLKIQERDGLYGVVNAVPSKNLLEMLESEVQRQEAVASYEPAQDEDPYAPVFLDDEILTKPLFIDITCNDAPLADILRHIRVTTGANLVWREDNVKGKRISMALSSVDWRDALTLAVEQVGLKIECVNDIYCIGEATVNDVEGEKVQEPEATKTVTSELWSAARKTLRFSGMGVIDGEDGEVIPAVIINAIPYKTGDLVSVDFNGFTFTWRIAGLTEGDGLRLERVSAKQN